jgi:tocopherol cyclase
MPSIPLLSFLLEPLKLLLSLTPLSFLLSPQDHFAPHPGVPFEGYYTRVVTSTGSTIVLILSSVFNSVDRPHYLHFSVLPRDATTSPRIEVHKFPRIADVAGHRFSTGFQEFSRVAKGDGAEGTYHFGRHEQRYRLELETEEHGSLEISVTTTQRKPWARNDELSTPEGIISRLVFLLPLHWNVFSTCSRAEYAIRQNGRLLDSGSGVAHIEKNWGVSFPRGWTWMQAFSGNQANPSSMRTFAMAGGKLLAQKAFMLGYRSEKLDWSFSSPITLMPLCSPTPFMAETYDSKKGTAHYEVGSLMKKIVVDVQAPAEHEGWLALNCPLEEGHGNKFAYESFDGNIVVKAYRRRWNLTWSLVEETVFEGAAVEFGGDYSFKVKR